MTTESKDTRQGIGSTVADAAGTAAGTIKSAAGDAADRLPEVASATRSALVEVDRQVQSGSDEMLTVGTALSFGVAAGLFLAGANRVLVVSALIPALTMGLTLLNRANPSRTMTKKSIGSDGRARLQGA